MGDYFRLIILSPGAEGGVSVPDLHGRWASEQQTGVLLERREAKWVMELPYLGAFLSCCRVSLNVWYLSEVHSYFKMS